MSLSHMKCVVRFIAQIFVTNRNQCARKINFSFKDWPASVPHCWLYNIYFGVQPISFPENTFFQAERKLSLTDIEWQQFPFDYRKFSITWISLPFHNASSHSAHVTHCNILLWPNVLHDRDQSESVPFAWKIGNDYLGIVYWIRTQNVIVTHTHNRSVHSVPVIIHVLNLKLK